MNIEGDTIKLCEVTKRIRNLIFSDENFINEDKYWFAVLGNFDPDPQNINIFRAYFDFRLTTDTEEIKGLDNIQLEKLIKEKLIGRCKKLISKLENNS